MARSDGTTVTWRLKVCRWIDSSLFTHGMKSAMHGAWSYPGHTDSVSGIIPTLPLEFVSEPEPETDSCLKQVTFIYFFHDELK